MKTVVFDLDGTLADTSGDLIAAANACFRDMNAGDMLDPATDAGTALRGGRAMLRLGSERMGRPSDDPLIDEYYDALLYHYARDIDTHTRLYDGAMEAVEALKARGYIVAICTNKPEALARELLTRMGILDAFAAMLGADSLPVRKPDPEHLFETVRRAGGILPSACWSEIAIQTEIPPRPQVWRRYWSLSGQQGAIWQHSSQRRCWRNTVICLIWWSNC